MGKNTDVKAVDSVSNLLKQDKTMLNDRMEQTEEAAEIEIEKSEKSKKIIIKKQSNNDL